MEEKKRNSKFWEDNNTDNKWPMFVNNPAWNEREGWPHVKVTLEIYLDNYSPHQAEDGLQPPLSMPKLCKTWQQICLFQESFRRTVAGIRSEFMELHPPFSRQFDALCARWLNILHTVESRKGDVTMIVRRRNNSDMILTIREISRLWHPAATAWNHLFMKAFPRKGWKEYRIAYHFLPHLARLPLTMTLNLEPLLCLNKEFTNLLTHWFLAVFVQRWSYHGRPTNELELQRAGPALLLAKGVALVEIALLSRRSVNGHATMTKTLFEYKIPDALPEVYHYIHEFKEYASYHGLHPTDANQFPWNSIADHKVIVDMMKRPLIDVFFRLMETPVPQGNWEGNVEILLAIRWNLIWRIECIDLWILQIRLLLDTPPQHGAVATQLRRRFEILREWHILITVAGRCILSFEEVFISEAKERHFGEDMRKITNQATREATKRCGSQWISLAKKLGKYVILLKAFQKEFPTTLEAALDHNSMFVDDERIIFSSPSSLVGHPTLPSETEVKRIPRTTMGAPDHNLTTANRTHWCLVQHSVTIDLRPLGQNQLVPLLAHVSCLTQTSFPTCGPVTLTPLLLAQDTVISWYKYEGKVDTRPDLILDEAQHKNWDSFLPYYFKIRNKNSMTKAVEFDLFPRFPQQNDVIIGVEVFEEDLDELEYNSEHKSAHQDLSILGLTQGIPHVESERKIPTPIAEINVSAPVLVDPIEDVQPSPSPDSKSINDLQTVESGIDPNEVRLEMKIYRDSCKTPDSELPDSDSSLTPADQDEHDVTEDEDFVVQIWNCQGCEITNIPIGTRCWICDRAKNPKRRFWKCFRCEHYRQISWRCNACGANKDTLPDDPEIQPYSDKHAWECSHCATYGISPTMDKCPGCHYDRSLIQVDNKRRSRLAKEITGTPTIGNEKLFLLERIWNMKRDENVFMSTEGMLFRRMEAKDPESKARYFAMHPLGYHIHCPEYSDPKLNNDTWPCKKCAHQNNVKWEYCRSCLKDRYLDVMGLQSSQWQCLYCRRTPISDDEKVCPNCDWVRPVKPTTVARVEQISSQVAKMRISERKSGRNLNNKNPGTHDAKAPTMVKLEKKKITDGKVSVPNSKTTQRTLGKITTKPQNVPPPSKTNRKKEDKNASDSDHSVASTRSVRSFQNAPSRNRPTTRSSARQNAPTVRRPSPRWNLHDETMD